VARKPRDGTADDGGTFQLERFEWTAPDRLEVAGSFTGITAPSASPELVLHGADGARRLAGAPVELADDDVQWASVFVWSGPPVPFDDAELDLGGGLSIGLPRPGERDETLEVRKAAPEAADLLRLRATALAAQEEAREADAARERLAQELARAREDLESERSRHAADAERFKQGLEQVRDAGEQALAATTAELAATRERASRLESALDEATGELEIARAATGEADRLRSRLEAVRLALDDGH
jgi:hypothetical protein